MANRGKTIRPAGRAEPKSKALAFFTTRRGAVLVMLAVMLAFTHYGVGRSLGARVRDVELQYIQDTKLRYQLDARIESGMNLITVTQKYSALAVQTRDLRDARNTLAELVDARAPAPEVAAANRALGRAVSAIDRALPQAALGAEDAALAESDIKRISDAGVVLSKTAYNEKALAFNSKVMDGFPTSVLRDLVGVDDAAVF